MKETIIGDFNLIRESIPAEGDVFMRLKPIDLISHWKRCGMLSNFAAAFYAYAREESAFQENVISTVFNELIENATKYSIRRGAEVAIHMMLYDAVLKVEIQNITTEHHFTKFKDHLQKLLNHSDLDELYFEIMSNKSEGSTDSGIGLLLLIKDYQVKIGAHFKENDGKFTVVIQALYYLD